MFYFIIFSLTFDVVKKNSEKFRGHGKNIKKCKKVVSGQNLIYVMNKSKCTINGNVYNFASHMYDVISQKMDIYILQKQGTTEIRLKRHRLNVNELYLPNKT